MTVSLETFEAMRNGEIDGTSAFMQGKLKVAGDMSVAMKLQSVMDSMKYFLNYFIISKTQPFY